MPSLYRFIRTRVTGALLMALGIIALLMPQVAGRWPLAILGVVLGGVGIVETYAAFRSGRSGEASSYLEGLFALLAHRKLGDGHLSKADRAAGGHVACQHDRCGNSKLW